MRIPDGEIFEEEMRMRIAYLILCHRNPDQVLTLINQLDDEKVDFYVHIDKKNTTFSLPERDNLFVLPIEERLDIRWATNSMVYATLNLAHTALNSNIQYDYLCLLSGQDFPIKSNFEIQEYLQANSGCNFIEILAKDHRLYRRYYKRTELYFPAWMYGRTNVCRIFKKLFIYLTGGFQRTFPLFLRKAPNGVSFAFGSQWWCLTRDCLQWIVDYLDNNPEVLAFFDNSLVPDECVFQTVFMLSPFSKTAKDTLTFWEWDASENHPRILTKADYELLINSDKLFARKFECEKDREIIELLIESMGKK